MIGLLGLGTVGQGVLEMIHRRRENGLQVKKILVRDPKKSRKIALEREQLVTDAKDILEDPDIGLILECTGADQAYDWIKKALCSGKHVITANKKIVAEHFEEFSDLAEENKVHFLYEASVAAGIPLIKPLREQLEWNTISQVEGVLNGTSNFILTAMEKKSYEDALKEAQDLGYAESDPAADVEGHDARRKLRILSTLAFQGKVAEEDIFTLGIQRLTLEDIKTFEEKNHRIKLLAFGEKKNRQVHVAVIPTALPFGHPLAELKGTENMGRFVGNHVDLLGFQGYGAGMFPTANGMLSDTMDVLYHRASLKNPLGEEILKIEPLQGQVYFRFDGEESEPWKALAERPFGKGYISRYVPIETFKDFPGAVILIREDDHAL